MNTPLDFQKATADRIFELFTKEGNSRQRVLLADEVGLGKTTVASSVVSKMRAYPPFQQDNFYRVVYVCSNINIARQNISQFGIDDILAPDESRLSMQHLILAEKEKGIRAKWEKKQDTVVPEVIIPLTPFTSFNFSSYTGSAQERALINVYLEMLDEFKGLETELSRFMKTRRMGSNANWNSHVERFRSRVKNGVSQEDSQWMIESIRSKDQTYKVLSRLRELIINPGQASEHDKLISQLRRMFADISLDRLSPDLVIMDEFQRFRHLIAESNDEQSLIAKKFFDKEDVKILLLSATPYKPFTTIEELNDSGEDEHFIDFKQVIHFLSGSNNAEESHFDNIWKKYNIALKKMSRGDLTILDAVKKDAEEALYSMMCRTERFNKGNIETREITVSTSNDDIAEYFQARRVLDATIEKTKRSDFRSIPLDYIKSCPYIFSFMEGYKLKQFIEPWETGRSRKTNIGSLYLQQSKVNNFNKINSGNARLEWLRQELFTDPFTSEKLLWVPASHPYYTTNGAYSKNKGFSKILVFSSWEMVPRMLSVMLTYTAEQKVIEALKPKRLPAKIKKYYNTNNERYARGRLAKLEDKDNPLLYPCAFLRNAYDPKRHLGMDIREIRSMVRNQIASELEAISSKFCIPSGEFPRGEIKGASLIRYVMEMLDGIDRSEDIECIPGNLAEILTDAAIGSPSICAMRTLPGATRVDCESLGTYFFKLFTRPEGSAVLDLCFASKSDCYVDAMFDYCVEGNLQAVLDEFIFITGEENFRTFFNGAPSEAVPVNVSMLDESNGGGIIKKNMRMSYAVQFAAIKMADKSVNRVANIRTAFNSPFRPFVLATTSVGQEGLDFHFYTRKLLHWNLPSNPVDMEQREGRVNRFRNLSIRQRLATQYNNIFSWDEIFSQAQKDYKDSYSDIVPSWSLPPKFKGSEDLKIERIILQYPMSIDKQRYARLEKILSLYRLTLGQPRQEALLDILANSKLDEDSIHKLMIDLCPFDKQKR